MNFRLVFRVTGKTLMVLSVTMLLPLLVCLLYRENPVPFLLAIAITAAGDTVIIVSRSHGILDINDIYDDALLDLGGVQ